MDMHTSISCKVVFLDLQKTRSQKLSMVEDKQGQFWYLQWIPHKAMKWYFQFSSYYSDDGRFSNRTTVISKILHEEKNWKYHFLASYGIQCRFQTVLGFLLVLIAFDFYSFLKLKKKKW